MRPFDRAPDSRPPRAPRACGALGRYEPGRVARVAAALGISADPVHAGESATLVLDCPPIRWRSWRERGLAWSEWPGRPAARRIRSWRQAATAGSACGLVLTGEGAMLHSSVSGTQGLYYLTAGEAVYFASRIDPLLLAATDGLLEPDWDAWAAILTFTHPIGDRTPFAEVSRVPPYATLAWRDGAVRVAEEPWPWAEVEPSPDFARGASEVVDRVRDAHDRMPQGELRIPLSGGWDSRVIAAALAGRRHAEIKTVTADVDDGTDREQRLAASVAETLELPNETVAASEEQFWPYLEERVGRGDYQRVATGWMMALVERLVAHGLPVTDGLGLDTLGQPGGRFATEAALQGSGGKDAARQLWRRLRRPLRVVTPELERALHASARRQFMAEAGRFSGHPALTTFTLYRTRTIRGISLFPRAVLGRELPVATPFVEDEVARALLAVDPRDKASGALYRAMFAALDPRVVALPSTNDSPPGQAVRPIVKHVPCVLHGYSMRLAEGPLVPYLNERGVLLVEQAQAGAPAAVPPGARAVAILHAWHRRYRDRLRDVDPAEALGASGDKAIRSA